MQWSTMISMRLIAKPAIFSRKRRSAVSRGSIRLQSSFLFNPSIHKIKSNRIELNWLLTPDTFLDRQSAFQSSNAQQRKTPLVLHQKACHLLTVLTANFWLHSSIHIKAKCHAPNCRTNSPRISAHKSISLSPAHVLRPFLSFHCNARHTYPVRILWLLPKHLHAHYHP